MYTLNNNPLKVIYTKSDVIAFRSRFPDSGLRDRSYWFEFDREGDLIDTDIPEHDDGPGASALAQNAKEFLFDFWQVNSR